MLDFNPHSHELHEDPYPVYREMRARHPLLRNAQHGFWAVSRWDDVVEALLRPHVFSSQRSLAATAATDPGVAMPMMILMDPPGHDDLRTLVNRGFTPRRIAQLEPRIRAIATDLIDRFVEKGSCDLWADLAAPLPTTVIAELLGVPKEDHEMFKAKSTAMVAAAGPVSSGAGGYEGASAAHELAAYLAGVFEAKRRRPGDDLMSGLLAAELDGRKLTPGELVGFAVLLLVAGNETTTNLICNAAVQLDRHPDQHARLVKDPALVPVAVEEFLRFDPPVQGLERFMAEDVDFLGERLRRGERVYLMLASANRDERAIPDPDRFDVARSPNRHLSFGFGTHFCLGASLARLEARVVWEEILARFPEFRVAGPTERLHSGVIRGLLKVPLEFQPVA
jgi:hypothetical protein